MYINQGWDFKECPYDIILSFLFLSCSIFTAQLQLLGKLPGSVMKVTHIHLFMTYSTKRFIVRQF